MNKQKMKKMTMDHWTRSNLNLKHVVWDGKRLYHYACRKLKHHKSSYLPEAETAANTNIKRKRSRAWMSHCVDFAVEGILNMGYYSEQHMLIVHDPYGNAPLTAMCLFTTKEACSVRVSLQDDFGWEFTSAPSRKHRIPIFCLRAGQKNEVLVETFREKEKIHEERIYLFTDTLPECLENTVIGNKEKTESAYPLSFVYGGDTRFPYAFDEKGEIRYYMSESPEAYGLFPMSSGRFLFVVHNVGAPASSSPHTVLACEMDFLGRTHREFLIENGICYDGCEMSPGGNILAVTGSRERYMDDAIIEINRISGEIVNKLCLSDILPEHLDMDSPDRVHIRTISYLEKEHCILIYVKDLPSVIKINWETFELVGICYDLNFRDEIVEKNRTCPFFADYEEYSKPMETMASLKDKIIESDYLLGIRGTLQSCKAPDLMHARPMPTVSVWKYFERKSNRKEVQRGEMEHELNDDLSEIYSRLYDRILLVFNRDHVIEKIYFCGQQHNYVRDFSQTTQCFPEQYAEKRYFLAAPIADLDADKYEICFQCRGHLYKLGKKLTVQ
jgi:arylsulfate sulfotransferase